MQKKLASYQEYVSIELLQLSRVSDKNAMKISECDSNFSLTGKCRKKYYIEYVIKYSCQDKI